MLKPIGTFCGAAFIALAAPAIAQDAAATTKTTATTPVASGNVLVVAKANPELSTFTKLAESANLVGTLASTGPITVLAPTNAAFAKLPPEQVAELSKPENAAKLQQVLLYHIIPGPVASSSLKGTKGEVPSATPAKLSVDGTGDMVKVNGATITQADIAASNGTIHIIDAVLMAPSATAAVPAPAPEPATSATN
jgi:uncharacterized surface protein with fasciclin (FAS1) repeats